MMMMMMMMIVYSLGELRRCFDIPMPDLRNIKKKTLFSDLSPHEKHFSRIRHFSKATQFMTKRIRRTDVGLACPC
jgi:hypothetical protein